MSYPEPRHLAATGEVSATVQAADREPDLLLGGTTVHYLATTASTSGEYGLYRWEMGPQPSGPEPHFHRSISESFYVLTGTVRLYDGERWTDSVPGDFHYVPPGGIHAFRNESGEPTSMLLLFAPGAPRERYFEGLAEIVASGRQLSAEEWTEFYRQHDQFMV